MKNSNLIDHYVTIKVFRVKLYIIANKYIIHALNKSINIILSTNALFVLHVTLYTASSHTYTKS